VKNALLTLGYNAVKDVRQGKVFEIELQDIDRQTAEKLVPEIADKVLANPIIEKFTWEIIES